MRAACTLCGCMHRRLRHLFLHVLQALYFCAPQIKSQHCPHCVAHLHTAFKPHAAAEATPTREGRRSRAVRYLACWPWVVVKCQM